MKKVVMVVLAAVGGIAAVGSYLKIKKQNTK